jgi:hypothetical protein
MVRPTARQRYPLERWLGGPQGRFGRLKIQRNRLPLTEIQSRVPGCPAHKLGDCVPSPTFVQLHR